MHDKLSKIMEIKSRFDHFNVNVTDLDRSLKFYAEALGLKEIGRKQAADGSFVLVYLGDGESPFRLELTWLRCFQKFCFDIQSSKTKIRE